ncbi:MAG TPA: plastocyanin/azurin family copper-binding protein [Chthoniobacterales bacterium]|jgi:plastocyanin
MAKLSFLQRIFIALGAGILLACFGAAPSSAATVSVDVAPGGQLMFSPSTVSIRAGDTVTWTWRASGHSVTSGTPGKPSGLFDSGVNSSGFTFSHTFKDLGTFTYYCMPHGACCAMTGSVTVAAATPTPSPAAAQPVNISTRLEVKTGDQVLIGGLIITGTAPKRVILRALGPSLAGAGITDPLADPFLELHASDQSVITTNDNWRDSPTADIEATGLAPSNDLESALVITLDPGSYTVIVNGKNGATGVGLVEAYDLDGSATSQLLNISTRGFVESGSNVMIGGFILGGGSENTKVLVRAIGPSLTGQGVAGALADPTLELHDGNGALIQSNDNWKDTQQTEIEATGLAPVNDLESAISETLAPGAYTAIVAGKGGTTGVGLVEVYRLP